MSGEGVTDVVFIAGLNNSSSTWRPAIGALPAGLTGHALDCPPIPDIDELAAALLADLPERFFVVGHSFGGYVALAMLAAASQRIAGLVLVNSGTGADSEAVAAGRLEKVAQTEAGGYEELANAASARAYHPDNAGDAALMDARAVGVREYGPSRYAAHQRATAARPDRTELTADAAVPKLVLAADHDVVVPTAKQRAMAEAIGAQYQEIPRSGHMMPAEQPILVAAAVADFVTAHQQQGATL
ncbi:alpha/beta hydrolase [Rhodococcus sp. H29-C3]|uniref:alpha/beta fold hydrolase n=1 Tax=Rhodococcus sp. H29-C3 TaxID=3046307 RepID=UPI0024BB2C7E|nr:alpha/beta hydrolase [Rhodococcus sp. H29-C3]MDJ0361873.1 alpha/beta hydrolase [Rhodococcus sp. H29-C3]